MLAAGLAFLAGALFGAIAIAPLIAALIFAIARRRSDLAPIILFSIGGALAKATSPAPAPILSRGTWILEGEVRSADADRIELDLSGGAPVGRPLAPLSGRLIAYGHCAPSDRARILARTRTVAPFGFEGERAEPPHTVAAIERCLPIGSAGLFAPIDRLRERMRTSIDRALPPERAAVVRAMAIGDRIRDRSPDGRSFDAVALRRDFADSGLSHLLAVSGQHLTIIASAFTVMLAGILARIPIVRDRFGVRRPAALAALAFVLGYTILVGAPASAVRAAVMVAILLAGEVIDRRRETWSALALAAVVMIALDPPVLDSLSFQLSFAAVAGILAFERSAAELADRFRRPRLLRASVSLVVTTFAATIGTAPILAHQVGRISLIGLLVNLPAVPLVSVLVLPLSLIGSALGAIWDPLGAPVLAAAGLGAEALIRLARAAASIPGATLAVSPLEVCLAIAALCSLRRKHLAIPVIGALAIVSIVDRWPDRPDELVMTVLPVGQGTSVLVESPGGARILIDTGPPDTTERSLLPYLLYRRIFALDLVVLSHPHADHTGGFELLARRASIEQVWTNGDPRDASPDLSRHDARTVTATIARLADLTLEVLHARSDAARVNDGSIALAIAYGSRRFLLAGDAENAAEMEMIASGRQLAADVLVVGHHGSKSSSSEAFLRAVRPSIAIIPVGRDNSFHHPHPSVVDRLSAIGARVFRTDRDGAVEVRTDGRSLEVKTFF